MSCKLKCGKPYFDNRNGCMKMTKCKENISNYIEDYIEDHIESDATKIVNSVSDLVSDKSTIKNLKKPVVWFLTSAGEGLYWDDIEKGFFDAITILRNNIKEAKFIRAGKGEKDEYNRIENQKNILKEIKNNVHNVDLLILTSANNEDTELVQLIKDIINDDNGIEVATADVYGFHDNNAITFFGPDPCAIGTKVAKDLDDTKFLSSSSKNILVLSIFPPWGSLKQKANCIKQYFAGKSNVDIFYLTGSDTLDEKINKVYNKLNDKNYNAIINTTLSTIMPAVHSIERYNNNIDNSKIYNYSTDNTQSYIDSENKYKIEDLKNLNKLDYAYGWNQYYIGFTSIFHCLSKVLLYSNTPKELLPFGIGNGDSSVDFNSLVKSELKHIASYGAAAIGSINFWNKFTTSNSISNKYIRIDAITDKDNISLNLLNTYLNYDFNWVNEKKISNKAHNQGDCNICTIAAGLTLLEYSLRANGNYIVDDHKQENENDILSLNFAVHKKFGKVCGGGLQFIGSGISELLLDNHKQFPFHNIYGNDRNLIRSFEEWSSNSNFPTHIANININKEYRGVIPISFNLDNNTIKYAAQQYIELLTYGPFIINIDCRGSVVDNYNKRIINNIQIMTDIYDTSLPIFTHAVAAVGIINLSEGHPLLVIKNSWGNGWGVTIDGNQRSIK